MSAERLKGKAVLLVGDLNMKHRGVEDVHWEYRHVCVPVCVAAVHQMALNAAAAAAASNAAALEAALPGAASSSAIAAPTPAAEASEGDIDQRGSSSGAAAPSAPTVSGWCEEVHPDVADLAARLGQVWPRLRAQLLDKTHRQVAYANAKQAMVPKWRVFVHKLNSASSSSSEAGSSALAAAAAGGWRAEAAASEAMLGKPLWSEEDAKMSYCLQPVGVTEAGAIVYGEAAADAAYAFGYTSPAVFSLSSFGSLQAPFFPPLFLTLVRPS